MAAGVSLEGATSPSTLGDIIPTACSSSFEIPSEFTPEERVVLTANGNLQRLVSSYYNATVTVTVRQSTKRAGTKAEYEREVELSVLDSPFATARSTVVLADERFIDAVDNHGVALGQLFRHFEVLPSFELLHARKEQNGAFERVYALRGQGVACTIHEQFPPGLFSIRVPAPATTTGVDPAAASDSLHVPTSLPTSLRPRGGLPHFGDIMAASQTGVAFCMAEFSPMQRVLLSANGNVQRIVSSYHSAPVAVHVSQSQPSLLGGFERQVSMSVFGQQFMTARSNVHLLRADWMSEAESGVLLGSIFEKMGVLPTFTLHSVGRAEWYFWRAYTLRSDGMVCEIHETFVMNVFELHPES